MGGVVELDRTNTLIEIQLFTQIDLGGHFDPAGPAHGRKSHGPEQDRIIGLDCLQGGFGKWISVTKVFARSNGKSMETEPYSTLLPHRSLQHFKRGFDHLRTYAIAGKNSDSVFIHTKRP